MRLSVFSALSAFQISTRNAENAEDVFTRIGRLIQ
jgi:hypothetical protein